VTFPVHCKRATPVYLCRTVSLVQATNARSVSATVEATWRFRLGSFGCVILRSTGRVERNQAASSGGDSRMVI
jgi:hypothetical protein